MKDKFTRTNIQNILQGFGLDTLEAQKATTKILQALATALAAGEPIELRGFGSIETRERKAYKAHNPRTGETVMTQARRRVLFRPGRELKDRLVTEVGG